jgi:hypothetical protein
METKFYVVLQLPGKWIGFSGSGGITTTYSDQLTQLLAIDGFLIDARDCADRLIVAPVPTPNGISKYRDNFGWLDEVSWAVYAEWWFHNGATIHIKTGEMSLSPALVFHTDAHSIIKRYSK